MKIQMSMLAASACALLLAIPTAAANGPAEKTSKNESAAAPVRNSWPPETISGKIAMVDSGRKLVVVTASDGVSFDMVVTPRTVIKSGERAVTLKDLTGDVNQAVSVKFIPERRGDVAETIQLNG